MTVGRLQIDRIIDLVTSIYSVDFHPIEPMIATAGGGMRFVNAITRIDSNILIWSTEPIFSKEKEEDENVRLLFDSLGYLILPDQEIVYQISEEQILRTLEKQSSKHLNRHDMIRAMIKLKEYSLAPDKISYEEQKEYTEFVKTVMQGIGDNCLPEEIE